MFGWLKTTAMMRKLRHRGRRLVQWMFTLALTGYNLVRMRTLTNQAANAWGEVCRPVGTGELAREFTEGLAKFGLLPNP